MTTTPLPPLPEPEGERLVDLTPAVYAMWERQMKAYAFAARADLEAEVKRLKQDAEELQFLTGDLLYWTERAVSKGNANCDIEAAWERYEEWMKASAALRSNP